MRTSGSRRWAGPRPCEAQVWLLRGQRGGLEDDEKKPPAEGATALPPYNWAAFSLSGDWR